VPAVLTHGERARARRARSLSLDLEQRTGGEAALRLVCARLDRDLTLEPVGPADPADHHLVLHAHVPTSG
jgi:hypothetical protein